MKQNFYTQSENTYPIRLQLLYISFYLNRQVQLKFCDLHWSVLIFYVLDDLVKIRCPNISHKFTDTGF